MTAYLQRLARAGYAIQLGAMGDKFYAAIDSPDYAHTEPADNWRDALARLNDLLERELGESAFEER